MLCFESTSSFFYQWQETKSLFELKSTIIGVLEDNFFSSAKKIYIANFLMWTPFTTISITLIYSSVSILSYVQLKKAKHKIYCTDFVYYVIKDIYNIYLVKLVASIFLFFPFFFSLQYGWIAGDWESHYHNYRYYWSQYPVSTLNWLPNFPHKV